MLRETYLERWISRSHIFVGTEALEDTRSMAFFFKCSFYVTAKSKKIQEFIVLFLERVQAGLKLPVQPSIAQNS